MKKRILWSAAILVALGMIPICASANNHGPEQTVGDVTVGAELGQGCFGVYAEKPDQGYQAVAVGGYGMQRREGKPGRSYHPDSTDMKDPDQSLCPSPGSSLAMK